MKRILIFILALFLLTIAVSSFAGGRGSGRHSGSSYHSSSRHRGTNTGIPGLSFSWKRAVGITAAKQKFARATGIPTSRQGRQAKIGRMIGIK
jgi:hypothetical protein